MVFLARATRGLRRPSLDARSERPGRPPLRMEERCVPSLIADASVSQVLVRVYALVVV